MLGPVLLVGCVLLGQVADAPDEELQLSVRRLVRQLNSPYLAQREGAEKQLVALGPKVLDLLPEDTDRTPEEVRQRLARIRQTLQQLLAESAVEASTVTLSGEAVPLSKALAALQEQSGNKIVDFRRRFQQQVTDPQLNLNLQDVPFWQAIDQILDQAGLKVYPYGEERTVCVVTKPEGELPRAERAAYSGPFRFEPIRVIARRDLREPGSGSLLFTLEVAWEPRLKPISLRQRMADLEVVDENGNPLTPARSPAELEVPAGDDTAVELTLPMALPPRSVKRIASVRGTLMAMIPGKIETFTFDDLLNAKNVEKRAAGVTVTLHQVRKNGPVWEFRIGVRFDRAGTALESHRGWVLNNECYLEGPDAKPIPHEGMQTTRRTQEEVGLAYLFVLDEPPSQHKLVYKTPGVIVATRFDYEIKDVKLP